MARVYPSDVSRAELAGGHVGELETLKVLKALKAQLADEYAVFHSVHWAREYTAWSHFGEIDFVVLHPNERVLLIEQKNGMLDETEDGLVKVYGNGAKHVENQIRRSVDKVLEKFKHQRRGDGHLEPDYLVYCPDYRVRDINAVGLDASRVVDAATRDRLPARIEELLSPHESKGQEWYELVRDFFTDSFRLVPDVHAHVSAQEKRFVRQTGPMVDILGHLEMEPFRLRVSATAGSGKSLMARQFYDRALKQGKRPLMVCFNRPLAEKWKALDGEGGYVNTYYGFCDDFLKSRGQRLDFERMRKEEGFWQSVQEQVTAEDIPDAWRFDAMVVDEGQDFEQEWYEILRLFLAEDGDVLWLEDPDQNLYGKGPMVSEGFVRYRCGTNYRTPQTIAHFIRKTLPFAFEEGNALPGLEVGVHEYASEREQPRIVGRLIQDLIKEGFTHDQIVVLSCRGLRRTVFSEVEKVGNLRLRRYTGEYDASGNQLMTEGRIAFDTVRRFKGQEAPAVILVDVDPDRERLEDSLSVLFCGMTRATARLDLVVNGGNSENRRFLDAV